MIKLNSLYQLIKQKATKENLDFDSDDLNGMILLFGDIFFPSITDIINLIFKARNNDFKEFDQKFVEDNFAIPELKSLCKLLVELNGLTSLIPFFRDFSREISQTLMKRGVEIASEKEKKEKS